MPTKLYPQDPEKFPAFLRIVMRVNLQPLAFMTHTFLRMIDRAVHVRHVPLSDALAGDEVLTRKLALLKPPHAATICALY